MKKLMTIAVVAMAAFASSAATITWGSGTMYSGKSSPSDTTGTKLNAGTNKGTGTLYYITQQQYDAIIADLVVSGAYSEEGAQKVYAAAAKGDYGAVAATATSNKSGVISLSDNADKTDGTTYYALVTYEIGTAPDNKIIVNAATYEMGPTSTTVQNMGLKVGGGASEIATAWGAAAAVPEPTCGLMLLVGLAGLALKRKRA